MFWLIKLQIGRNIFSMRRQKINHPPLVHPFPFPSEHFRIHEDRNSWLEEFSNQGQGRWAGGDIDTDLAGSTKLGGSARIASCCSHILSDKSFCVLMNRKAVWRWYSLPIRSCSACISGGKRSFILQKKGFDKTKVHCYFIKQ